MENQNIETQERNEKNFEIYELVKNIFGEKLANYENIVFKKNTDEVKEILKSIMKNLAEDVDMNFYLHSKGYLDFIKKFPMSKEFFVKVFEESVFEKREQFLSSPVVKKILSETLGELPNCLARVYNINLGLETKADGTELTLKEFSLLCNDDHKINEKLLESAKCLLDQKIKRRLGGKRI